MSLVRNSRRGGATLQVLLMVTIMAFVLASGLVWQTNIQTAVRHHVFAREAAREEIRLRVAAAALARQRFIANDPRIFGGIAANTVNPLLTADPRYVGFPPGGAMTPGFSLASLSTPAPPALFSATPTFETRAGVSPLDSLRQVVFVSSFPYVLSRRTTPAAAAASLPSKSGTFSFTLREVPLTQFSLVTFESLSIEGGLSFSGTSLVLGQCASSGAAFNLRVSPFAIPDAQVGIAERVWEQSGLFASLFTTPGDLLDPSAAGPEQQNLARKGQRIDFDGYVLTTDGVVPGGVAVATYGAGSAKRVVVTLAALPQTNVRIDAQSADVAGNRISAYHINCTTALARDRGVVIIGSSADRLGDVVTTNGALFLEGQHTGGPLLVGSSYGGVLVNNNVGGGDVDWNAYVVLPATSPYLSASTTAGIAGARVFSVAAGSLPLSASEQGYDSVGLQVTPTSDTAPFSVGFGSVVAPGAPQVWLEGDATSLRVGVRTAAGTAAYSSATPRGNGSVQVTLSRSQNALKVSLSSGTLYYTISGISADRPRIESTAAMWSGGISALNVVSSAAGTVVGGTSPGTIGLRSLMALGTVSRFGPAVFSFRPASVADGIEKIAPRLVIMDL